MFPPTLKDRHFIGSNLQPRPHPETSLTFEEAIDNIKPFTTVIDQTVLNQFSAAFSATWDLSCRLQSGI